VEVQEDYREGKNIQADMKHMPKAIERAPENILARHALAGTYGMMGREEEARAEAAEVLRINPKF